ncbi:hypothetical protein [Natrinema salifodinae]|uniref:DUF8106 domain-containing protein n=1 Tax=Natrinema salifodinae TaxID=1202768 RepID=A0A1I0LXZ7_9EURY|nr:hypothetical protein [Natrinema salifodinae]SEV80687.1 hypothetical protein SAMN05216285_0140 [Natrinema salifodinae]
MTGPAPDRSDGGPTRRKATLFCWECDHSSPIDGDWHRRSADRHVAYVCPDCETTLATRPRSGESVAEPESEMDQATPNPLTAWRRAFRTTATVWRASVDIGFVGLPALCGIPPVWSRRSGLGRPAVRTVTRPHARGDHCR